MKSNISTSTDKSGATMEHNPLYMSDIPVNTQASHLTSVVSTGCVSVPLLPAVHSSFWSAGNRRTKNPPQDLSMKWTQHLLLPSKQFINRFRVCFLFPSPAAVCHHNISAGPIRSELTHNWFTSYRLGSWRRRWECGSGGGALLLSPAAWQTQLLWPHKTFFFTTEHVVSMMCK